MTLDATAVRRYATAGDGLGAELALLDAVAEARGRADGFLWTTSRCLVVPRQVASRAGFERARARSAARGWPVETRRTGGGTTPQGPEILNIALVRRSEPGVDAAATYTGLCRLIVDAVRELGLAASIGPCPGAFCDGGHNVLLDGRKLAGTAQRWRRVARGPGHAILAHALIVLGGDLAGALDAIASFEADSGGAFRPDPAAHVSLHDALGGAVSITAEGFARHLSRGAGATVPERRGVSWSRGPSVERVELDVLARSSVAPGRHRATERTARDDGRAVPNGIAQGHAPSETVDHRRTAGFDGV